MWQQPTDSDFQPFVSTTVRYVLAALPFGCSPCQSSLFSLSGSAAILIATFEKNVWSVWGASIGFTSRKTTAEKPTVPHTTVKDMDTPPKHPRAESRRTRAVAQGQTRGRNGSIPSRYISTKATIRSCCEGARTGSARCLHSSMNLPSTATSVRRCRRRIPPISAPCQAWRTTSTNSPMRLTSTISPLLKRGAWNWLGGLTRFSSVWAILRDIYLLVPLCALTLPSICTYLGIYLHILFYGNFYDSTD